jgi:hypothetical protein
LLARQNHSHYGQGAGEGLLVTWMLLCLPRYKKVVFKKDHENTTKELLFKFLNYFFYSYSSTNDAEEYVDINCFDLSLTSEGEFSLICSGRTNAKDQ